MFLEETIDSLDAEADSGVSTDETDYAEPSKAWSKREVIPKGKAELACRSSDSSLLYLPQGLYFKTRSWLELMLAGGQVALHQLSSFISENLVLVN